MRRAIGLLSVLGLTLLLAACGGGNSDGAADDGSVQSEGIEVHGDWEITVYDADGTLDEQYVFANALNPTGSDAIVRLLARTRTAGGWKIFLDNSSLEAPCPSFCRIEEAGTPGAAESDNLVVEVVGTSPAVLRLSGSVVAEQDGDIGSVGTRVDSCEPSTVTDNCLGSSFGDLSFTTKVFDPVEKPSATAGQIIQVQVDISFASPAP